MNSKIVICKSDDSTKISSRYFLEKTSNLLYNLLIGEGDAKSRLRDNELLVTYVLVLDIPTELRVKQKAISNLLTKKQATKFEGKTIITSYQNSISSIRNVTAAKIIKQINSLYYEVKCYGNKSE
jgi:hypothetical protein